MVVLYGGMTTAQRRETEELLKTPDTEERLVLATGRYLGEGFGRIFAAQPNLLGSVLAQHSLGVSMPTIEVLLNILIVLYLAIEESGQVLAVVSEADQERELQRFTAAVRFTEGLGSDALAQSIEQTIAYRREKFLFAYVVGILQRAGLTDLRSETSKYPTLVAINLVNCIATARRTTPL